MDMKRILSPQTDLAIAALVVACVLALPSTGRAGQAQDRASAGGAASGGGAGASAGGGAATGGGAVDRASAGSGGGFSGGSSRSDSGGSRAGATGGSGMAVPRASSGDRSSGGSTPRHTGGGSIGTRAAGRTQDDAEKPSGVPRYSRPRDPNEPTQGTAVPRPPDSRPTRGTGGTTYIVPGGYYGGYGYGYPYGGSYFGGFYDPWYDPWYGGYPGYGYPQTGGGFSDEGLLRLKIKPRDAEVYVDGFFAGIVDEFDGVFQRLHLESGAHRIEVRAPGYETLTFDVRIVPDRKTTYQGEMQRIH
jgi:PEGA domain